MITSVQEKERKNPAMLVLTLGAVQQTSPQESQYVFTPVAIEQVDGRKASDRDSYGFIEWIGGIDCEFGTVPTLSASAYHYDSAQRLLQEHHPELSFQNPFSDEPSLLVRFLDRTYHTRILNPDEQRVFMTKLSGLHTPALRHARHLHYHSKKK